MAAGRIFWTFAVLIIGTLSSQDASAEGCTKTSITKPSPFMGNNGEVFKLADGSLWQVKYEYEYLYEYYPTVVICPSQNLLIIKGKKLNVVPLAPQRKAGSGASHDGNSIIESRIDGDFNGWEGETVYQLTNGQIWQQSGYHYHYHYAFSPKVMIYSEGGSFKMIVEGDSDQPINVRRLR